eukprot:gb/GECH01009086.1/.p1 GENE.gb/GECH01009086.1/~~gb/GECH01009086.1/.p1  ORF type:complete len:116 (+),score=9.90 gb/GECH01009086.1/:1-348(+)
MDEKVSYSRRFSKSFWRLHEMWSGLGYYTRARNIHKCAQVLVNQYNGTLPKEAPELEKLPGIGKYTAGAISSIAYDKCYPLVGNRSFMVQFLFIDSLRSFFFYFYFYLLRHSIYN